MSIGTIFSLNRKYLKNKSGKNDVIIFPCKSPQICFVLSPGQTIATFQRSIVGCNILHAFGHPVATCSYMLGVVGSNFKMAEFFMQHLCCCMFHVAWCSCLARFVLQCCMLHVACAVVRFSTCNMSKHVATGWPNACNMLRPTKLRSVAFKCKAPAKR